MSKIFSLLLLLCLMDCHCGTTRVYSICSPQHIKTLFLGLGEAGVLTASNVSTRDFGNVSFHEICQTDIVTCPSCVISLHFRLMNLSCYCGLSSNLFLHNPCRCDYVWVSEPPYSAASGVSFCKLFPFMDSQDRSLTYKSRTRAVRIWFFYRRFHAHAFTVEYKSEQNRQVFFGTLQHQELNFSTGHISSPFFPAVYPKDLVAEYSLICIKSTNFSIEEPDARAPFDGDKTCRVHLTFTDFHLSSSSVIEFFDGSRRVGVVSGTSFRPPVILSKTNSLTLRFYSFGYNNMGFKAAFSFVSEKNISGNLAKPNTDCGGLVDNFGGTIAMVKMVKSHVKLFDCIWIIKPLKTFYNAEGYLYLKLSNFLSFAGNAEVQIREGLTSESTVLETLRYPTLQNFQEHVVSLQSGFYISLRGVFGPATKFTVTYASFSRNKCAIFPGFLCKNLRCIEKGLICDGSDHCGDSSDEPVACNRKWGSNSAELVNQQSNYYFPKINEYSEAKTASLVFLVSLLGLIFLTSTVTIALYRMVSKARQQGTLQDDLQSVRNLRDCISDEVSVEDVVIDDPPSYEAPPNYEEVVKRSKNNSATTLANCTRIVPFSQ